MEIKGLTMQYAIINRSRIHGTIRSMLRDFIRKASTGIFRKRNQLSNNGLL